MGKQRLVVIGNGMAGARAVEEILARGGAEQFDITMFGDEPYGNYNRILLSNVLNGAQDAERDLPQPARLVRRERHPPARRACASIDDRPRCHARCVAGDGVVEPYDKLIIATGSRPFIPPIARPVRPQRATAARRLRLPHAGRLPRHRCRAAGQAKKAVGHRRRPARASRPRAACSPTAARCTSSTSRAT